MLAYVHLLQIKLH